MSILQLKLIEFILPAITYFNWLNRVVRNYKTLKAIATAIKDRVMASQ